MRDNQTSFQRYLITAAATITAAVVLQTGSLIWWASATNQRVNYLESNMAQIQESIRDLAKSITPHSPAT
jgi:hypothetical protein